MKVMPADSTRFSVALHTLFMVGGITLVYWWLHVPSLVGYSLQLFVVIGLAYFFLKSLTKSKAWHILPANMSAETVLATMSFLLLIGSTGNTSSWFYPLTYIHLFFIVFSSHTLTSIITTLLIMLFHYGLSPNLAQHELISLMTLPVIMVFFLFAKSQHREVVQDRLLLEEEEATLHQLESTEFRLESFLQHFLQPKIEQVENLLQKQGLDQTQGRNNLSLVREQLQLIRLKVEELLQQIKAEK